MQREMRTRCCFFFRRTVGRYCREVLLLAAANCSFLFARACRRGCSGRWVANSLRLCAAVGLVVGLIT